MAAKVESTESFIDRQDRLHHIRDILARRKHLPASLWQHSLSSETLSLNVPKSPAHLVLSQQGELIILSVKNGQYGPETERFFFDQFGGLRRTVQPRESLVPEEKIEAYLQLLSPTPNTQLPKPSTGIR